MTINNFNFKTESIESILKTVDNKSEFLSLYKSALKQVLENNTCNKLLKNLYLYEKLTFDHSVNVSMIAAAIVYNDKIINISMLDVINASLFHDIGKTMINKQIITGEHKLSKHEKKLISLHPVFGYNMLVNVPISNTAKKGVLYHHSNVSGTGYPNKLSNKEIPDIGKIIKIADVYDALVSKRSYKEAKNPIDAGKYILAHTDTQFDKQFTNTIEKLVNLYIEEESIFYANKII